MSAGVVDQVERAEPRRWRTAEAAGHEWELGERLRQLNVEPVLVFRRQISNLRRYVIGQNLLRTAGLPGALEGSEVMSMKRYWAIYDVYLGNPVLVERC